MSDDGEVQQEVPVQQENEEVMPSETVDLLQQVECVQDCERYWHNYLEDDSIYPRCGGWEDFYNDQLRDGILRGCIESCTQTGGEWSMS